MPCGCLTGTYETWTSEVVEIVDAHAAACTITGHVTHAVLWRRLACLPGEPAPLDPPEALSATAVRELG